MAEKRSSNQFVVDLGDVQLPPDAAKRLGEELRRLALATVAGLDFQGDVQVSRTLSKEFGGRTDGIWVDVAQNLNR